jgi:hypothetical protein
MVEGARAKALPPFLCTAIDEDAIGWSGREAVRLARQGQSRISNPFIHVLVRLSDLQSLRARRE